MRKSGFILALSMMLFIAHSRAEAGVEIIHGKFEDLSRSPVPVTITKVIDGTTLLAKDGTIYQLPNLYIPDTQTDLAKKTQDKLSKLTIDQKCSLYLTRKPDTGRVNRMGHALAELECRDDNIWISGQLISEGLAIVWPSANNPEMVDDLLKFENEARRNKRNLWSCHSEEAQRTEESPFKQKEDPSPMAQDDSFCFRVYTPESVKQHINARAIVEGTVYTTALVKNTIYLNFEQDWKTDFTIVISSHLRRAFAKKNINLQSLKGAKVRVRGWVRDYNGPVIELENAGQLEVLGNAPELNMDHPTQPEDPTKPVAGMHTIKGPATPVIPSVRPEGNLTRTGSIKQIDSGLRRNDE